MSKEDEDVTGRHIMAVSISKPDKFLGANRGARDKSICDEMSFPRCPLDNKIVHGNLLTHGLKPRPGQVKKVLLENAFQRSVISQHEEI